MSPIPEKKQCLLFGLLFLTASLEHCLVETAQHNLSLHFSDPLIKLNGYALLDTSLLSRLRIYSFYHPLCLPFSLFIQLLFDQKRHQIAIFACPEPPICYQLQTASSGYIYSLFCVNHRSPSDLVLLRNRRYPQSSCEFPSC